MKRLFSVVLALALAWTLAAPAAAEESTGQGDMEAALTEITAAVKKTLDVSDDYTEFSGHYNDGLRPGWNLCWSREGEDLSVTCDETGVITEVYRWKDSGVRQTFSGFAAHVPARSEAESRAEALRCLRRLMGENEIARIDHTAVSLWENGNYRFTGTIRKNGLESPVTFRVVIDADGLASYERSDGYTGYVGELPSAQAGIDRKTAAAALAQAVMMELYYVTGPDGQARLRYVPTGPYTVVDAQSGEAVDMDALYASFGGAARNGLEMPAAEESAMTADAGGGRGLTEVELSSIANYRDALPPEALDEALRALPAMGLDGFELARCSYAMDGDGNVTARLRYTCEMTEDNRFGFTQSAYEEYLSWGDTPIVYKTCTADAKTGALVSVSTEYPLWEREASGAADRAAATAFAEAAAPERFAESAVCTLRGYDEKTGVTFSRVHDGYFFPENYLYVEMNPATGAVDTFYSVWDDEADFAPSKGIADEIAAKEAYIGALDMTLGYVAWPEAIDYGDPVLYRYADWGYTFVESLRLAWYYGGTAEVAGVDALTGEPVTERADGTFSYDDLEGQDCQAAAEALGAAGIGFDGGCFAPAQTLTQRDAVRLLLQAAGYSLRGQNEDDLKNEAVWMGFLREDEWDPESAVTGEVFARMMLGASTYAAAAELPGIWAADYADGYAAVAAALGMTVPRGDCTRADAAQTLYEFMTR